MKRLDTTYSRLAWSPDGMGITKSRPRSLEARRRYRYELRVNRLLCEEPPPVRTPRMLTADEGSLSITFEAIQGEPLGPKYPQGLDAVDLDGIVEIAQQLALFNPRRRWLRRYDSVRRLELARRFGLLSEGQTTKLVALARVAHRTTHFGHGDFTARNVMRDDCGMWLIDWEWAGLYPPGYELAFLWFSLVDLAGGRARVEEVVTGDKAAFLLSALLIQLWHLQWYVPVQFRHRHLKTRDELLARLAA